MTARQFHYPQDNIEQKHEYTPPLRGGSGVRTMRIFLFGLLGGLALALTGCGGPTLYTVSGTVTYNGEPIPEGYIAFVPVGPGRGGGGTITNGSYEARAQTGK